ncbi:MAG: hypothetical protein PVG39_10710 [Desulfobacteraceae bacterium]|jgi:hypothetical protein
MPLKKYIINILLICFILPAYNAAGSSSINKNIFPDISGFPKSGEVSTYKPETLFEFMNGAAELYLLYDFAEMNVQVYEDKQGNTINIEIYDHQNINNSFGIYSQERPYECEFLSVGTQANYIEGYLNFYQGRYYVKLSGYSLGAKDKEILTTAGKTISTRLNEKTYPPQALELFPDAQKMKNKEEYITKDYLGYSFFKNVFTADYGNSESSYKLFIIGAPDRSTLEKSINEYKKKIGFTQNILKGGIHEVEDPYQGKLILSVSGNYIAGILNPDNVKVNMDIFKQMILNLK